MHYVKYMCIDYLLAYKLVSGYKDLVVHAYMTKI